MARNTIRATIHAPSSHLYDAPYIKSGADEVIRRRSEPLSPDDIPCGEPITETISVSYDNGM